MADASDASAGSAQSGFVVPPRIREKFPEISALIMASESMNDEERGYWTDMLSVMTPPQLDQLRGILQNEKDQLAAIDAKYGKKLQEMTSPKRDTADIQAERRGKSQERQSKEQEAREQEENTAEQILREIE